jgi:hypothetical protein
MTQKQIAMIRELETNIRAIAGQDVTGRVMDGIDSVKASTDNVKVAEWVQGAMKRLDEQVQADKRDKIMAACGLNCTRINHRTIQMFQKRRARYPSLDDFLYAEAKSPMKGTKLWREGNTIVQAYCPSDYSRRMRCYCALVSELPANKTISPTYCQCSRAFVQQMWRETTGQPVSVVLLKSALSGAAECHFRISFKE